MKIYGTNRDAVRDVAGALGLGIEWGGSRGERLTLRPLGARYALRNPLPRAKGKPTVCLHGYEDFIEDLLTAHPGATVVTPVTTYEGFDDFDARQADVWDALVEKYGEPDCDCEVDE